MKKLLIKRQFHNDFLGKTGIELIGEPGSGKTLQLVLEAHLNDGILVVPSNDIAKMRLKDLKIESSNIEIMNYTQFKNSVTHNVYLDNKPVYIDQIDIFQKQYNLPTSTYRNVCGYTADLISFDNRFMNELGNKNMFEEI